MLKLICRPWFISALLISNLIHLSLKFVGLHYFRFTIVECHSLRTNICRTWLCLALHLSKLSHFKFTSVEHNLYWKMKCVTLAMFRWRKGSILIYVTHMLVAQPPSGLQTWLLRHSMWNFTTKMIGSLPELNKCTSGARANPSKMSEVRQMWDEV